MIKWFKHFYQYQYTNWPPRSSLCKVRFVLSSRVPPLKIVYITNFPAEFLFERRRLPTLENFPIFLHVKGYKDDAQNKDKYFDHTFPEEEFLQNWEHEFMKPNSPSLKEETALHVNMCETEKQKPFLRLLKNAATTINRRNLFEVLRAIKNGENCNISTDDLKQNADFKRLISELESWYMKMNSTELIMVLELYSNLHLDFNEVYIKRLLRVLKFHLSAIRPKRILWLDSILRKSRSELSNAIHNCLPLMIEKYLNKKELREMKNLPTVIALAEFCTTNRVRGTHVIFEHLSDVGGIYSPRYVLQTLYCILDLTSSSIFNLLFPSEKRLILDTITKECFMVIARSIYEHSCEDLLRVLDSSVGSFQNGMDFIYHEYFLHELSERAVAEQWTLGNLIRIASKQFLLHFIQEKLLRHLILVFNSTPDTNLENKMAEVICSFSCMNEIPPELEEVLETIFRNNDVYSLLKDMSLSTKAVELLSLGYFHKELLTFLLDEQVTKSTYKPCDLKNLLLINCVLRRNQTFPHLNLSENIKKQLVKEVGEQNGQNHNPSDILENIIKNSDQFIALVHYDFELFIDKLLVVDEYGDLVTFTDKIIHYSEETYISYKELGVKDTHKRIAILDVPSQLSFNGGKYFHGSLKLLRQNLESVGFTVLLCEEMASQTDQEMNLKQELLHLGVKLS